MKKRHRCSTVTNETGCHGVRESQKVQPFPTSGVLADNANWHLADLRSELQNERGMARSYVVTSVQSNSIVPLHFEQTGSGPNFQGGVLSLCTCKHQMRSRLTAKEWEGKVWIAGFTSRTLYRDNKHWLFYLARIKSAYESHSHLWHGQDSDYRKDKAAHIHYLGDLYKPFSPKPTGDAMFSASRYLMPENHDHRKYPGDNGWKRDINYRHALTARHAPLLVADPRLTFLWDTPTIFVRKKHCRDYHKWSSLQKLIALLQER